MTETPERTKTGRPESPTTARELDWDDDDVPSSPKPGRTAGNDTEVIRSDSTAHQPKSQQPTPLDPRAQAEATLQEAFPAIDATVIKAVLMASGGQVEPAFNALLSMSDPSAQIEPTPPNPPPRPAQQAQLTPAERQMLQDEQYARQLAEHYNNQGGYGQSGGEHYGYEGQPPRLPRRPGQPRNDDLYDDRERSFIDDDLPAIRDNIKKGFLETQNKAMNFINNIRKQFDGEESDEEQPPPPPPRKNQGQQAYSRRSGDRDRYDADPQVLGDDFTKLQMQDDTIPHRGSPRPQANPDLFKSTSAQSSARKVSFQEARQDDDLYSASPDIVKKPATAGTKSKWQPMAAVAPDPVQEHDPFSLGDSDDESSKKKDLKPEDSERLKQATAEAMADSIGDSDSKTLKPAETTGTKDTEALEKLGSKP